MQADALRPLKSSLDDVDAPTDDEKPEARTSPYSEEELEEALQFLRLNVRLRPYSLPSISSAQSN